MNLLEQINLYFGTEHETITGFIKDIKRGDLSADYEEDSEKLTHLLMFLSAYSRAEEFEKGN